MNTSILIRLARPIIHGAIILLAFYISYIIRLETDLIPFVQLGIPPIPLQETIIYGILSVFVFRFLAIIRKLYTVSRKTEKYFNKLIKIWTYRIIVITFIAYFGLGFIFPSGISRFIIVFSGIITLILLASFDYLRNDLENLSMKNEKNKILIISDDLEKSKSILNKFENETFIIHTITTDQYIDIDHNDYHTTLAIGSIPYLQLQNIIDKIRLSNSRFLHIAEGIFLEDIIYSTETIGPLVALEYKHSRLEEWSIILKRLFDIIFSFLVIILGSPIIFITMILVKITSPGPIFYTQTRIGKYGRPFTFIKFRTMYTHLSTGEGFGGKDAEKLYNDLISSANERSGIIPKIKNDPRITPLGRFLRRTSLDEVPQFFLVLWGTMSVVGPRPHLPQEVEKYDIWHTRLLSIKPGITGYAQIFGRHKLDFNDEAKLDLYYIKNRSIWLDAYIIIMTIKVLFQGK